MICEVRMGQFIRCNGYTAKQTKFPSNSARYNSKTMQLAWIGVRYLRRISGRLKSMTSPTLTLYAGWKSVTHRSKSCTRWSLIKPWATIMNKSRWKRPSHTEWHWTDKVSNQLSLSGRWCAITSKWWNIDGFFTPSGSKKVVQCAVSASPASSASRSSKATVSVVLLSDHQWIGWGARDDP